MDGRWGQDWLSDGLEAGRAGGPGGWGTLAGPGVPRAKRGWRSQEVRGWRSYTVRAGGPRGAGRGGRRSTLAKGHRHRREVPPAGGPLTCASSPSTPVCVPVSFLGVKCGRHSA